MNTHSPAADPGRHIGLLQEKVAVITGAGVAEGIGATCAALFVREGARVLVADISGMQNGGNLGQASFTLDYLFSRGKVGLFGSKGFMNSAVIKIAMTSRFAPHILKP